MLKFVQAVISNHPFQLEPPELGTRIKGAVECHEKTHKKQWRNRYSQRWSQGFWRGMRLTEWYTGRLVDMGMPCYEIEAYTVSQQYLENVLKEAEGQGK
jgi:hypothetical protein